MVDWKERKIEQSMHARIIVGESEITLSVVPLRSTYLLMYERCKKSNSFFASPLETVAAKITRRGHTEIQTVVGDSHPCAGVRFWESMDQEETLSM